MGRLSVIIITIVLIGGFTALSDILSPIIGSYVSQGRLNYSYSKGEEAITRITFKIDPTLAENIMIKNVPSGWSYTLEGDTLVLSGGSLPPGGSVSIEYSLKRYIPPGELPVTATGSTLGGQTVQSTGRVVVSENIILLIIYIFIILKIPILVVLAGIGGLAVTSHLKKPSKKEPIPKKVEESEEKLEKPIIPVKEPKKEKQLGCQLSYSWFHQLFMLDIKADSGRKPPGDPLPLEAIASDFHWVIIECRCPKNPNAVAREPVGFYAKVRYEWTLTGDGFLIDRTDSINMSKTAKGSQILYMPPDLKEDGDTAKATIKVSVYHDDETKKPNHPPLEAIINVSVRRIIREKGKDSGKQTIVNEHDTADPKVTYVVYYSGEIMDYYEYNVDIQKPKPIIRDPPEKTTGPCKPSYKWLKGSDIDVKIDNLPMDVDNNPVIVALGEYVRLIARGSDVDILKVECNPDGQTCKEPCSGELKLNDQILYIWSASAGEFPLSTYPAGEVIWRAPEQEGEVVISVEALNSPHQYENTSKKTEIKVMVKKLGIDLVKTPKNWLPDARAGTLKTKTKLYICMNGKWVPTNRKRFVKLMLYNVSGERGVCMNYPIYANTNPDLFFYEELMKDKYNLLFDYTESRNCPTDILRRNDNPGHLHHYLGMTSKERINEDDIVVRCEDYGAVGNLKAEAVHAVSIPPREDMNSVHDHCREGSNSIKIPRDDNNNDIADIAPQDAGGAAPHLDNDNNPIGDGYKGDGLTNYEEYRGFIVGGGRHPKRHIRTSIHHKDVFVYDRYNLGTGFLNKSGLRIHLIYLASLFNGVGSRIINYNRGRHSGGAQHGLWLKISNKLPKGVLGVACGDSEPGLPKTRKHICISSRSIPKLTSKQLKATITHELAHGLNVWHHGEARNHTCFGLKNINRVGGVTSGDDTCVMRYENFAYGWCHGILHYRHLTYYDPATRTWKDSAGTTFCTSNRGTGVNSVGKHRNDASRGNCMSQIRVKDW